MDSRRKTSDQFWARTVQTREVLSLIWARKLPAFEKPWTRKSKKGGSSRKRASLGKLWKLEKLFLEKLFKGKLEEALLKDLRSEAL